MNPTNGLTTVDADSNLINIRDRKRNKGEAGSATGIGGGADISAASFFVYDPLNAQGNELGEERNEDANKGYFQFAASVLDLAKKPQEEIKSAVDESQAAGGSQSVPDGGQVKGWTASEHFGLNETYDYLGDADDYEF